MAVVMPIPKSVTENPQQISCRPAGYQDLPNLLKIEQSAFPPERWASEASLNQRLELPDSVTLIAFLKTIPVGFANGFPVSDCSTQETLDQDDSILYSKGSNYWLLRNVAVHQSFQSTGVGKFLIQAQLAAARKYGAKYLRFTATENLTSYYQSLGFQMIHPAKYFHGLPQAVFQSEF